MDKSANSDDGIMKKHIVAVLESLENVDRAAIPYYRHFFVGISHKDSVFIDHTIDGILSGGARKSLLYFFTDDGLVSRYIDDHYQVHDEFVDGTWKISVNYGDKLEIRLSNGKYVSSMFSTIENFGEDFKRVWNEYRRLKNS